MLGELLAEDRGQITNRDRHLHRRAPAYSADESGNTEAKLWEWS